MFSDTKSKINLFFFNKGKKIGVDLPYFVNNGFWLVLKQLVGSICGLSLSIAFARLTTKDIFGQYQLILSIFSMVSIISIPGLNISVARSVARGNDGDYRDSVRKSFFWSLFGIPALWIIGIYYYLHISQVFGITLIVSGFFFPFLYSTNTWGGFLMGKSKFDAYTKFDIILEITNLFLMSLMIYLKPDSLLTIAITYFSIYSFFNGLFYFKTLSFVGNNKKSPDTIKYGWFLTFNYNIELIAESINKVIIGVFLSPSLLAAYTIVSLVPVKFRNVFKPFLNILFPKMTSDRVDIVEKIKMNKIFFYFLFIGIIAIGLVYFFLIDELNLLLFGENYADFYHYAKYFVISMVLNFPVLVLTKYIQAKKMEKAIFYTGPVFLALRTVLTVIFIYFWSILGAVIAFNVGSIIRFIMFLIFLIKHKKQYVR